MRSDFRNILRNWRFDPAMHLATFSVLVGVFCILTLSFTFKQNVNRVLSFWGESIKMTVYLEDERSKDQEASVETYLKGLEDLDSVKFISKTEAAKSFMTRMGRFVPEVLNDPKFENPLPDSFEVKLHEGASAIGKYEQIVGLADRLSKLPGVEEVSYGQAWLQNYSSFVDRISQLGWLLMIVMLVGSLFIVSNSIQSSISHRRDEIEILELVGATPQMIRRPFIIEGVILGLASSAMALAICYLVFGSQKNFVLDQLQFLGLGEVISYLSLAEILVVLLWGALCGALGAIFCVSRMATGWSAAEGHFGGSPS